jgi:hypothetical protein
MPEDLGFGEGKCRMMDFGYSFRHIPGTLYKANRFSEGATKAIELETTGTTTELFKVDSWYLGQLVSALHMNSHRLSNAQ